MRAAIFILIPVLLAGCDKIDDSWDKNAKFATIKQPSNSEIPGNYLITQQTIVSNGMSVFMGKLCQLSLKPDGSFVITNYPVWAGTNHQPDRFLSATGRWQCEVVGIVRDKDLWGIRFVDTDQNLDSFSFMGTAAPYRLFMIYGDPDENRFMIFEKQTRAGDTTGN